MSPRLTGNQSERQIQKHRHEVPEVAQLLAGLKNGKKRPNDWSRAENWEGGTEVGDSQVIRACGPSGI